MTNHIHPHLLENVNKNVYQRSVITCLDMWYISANLKVHTLYAVFLSCYIYGIPLSHNNLDLQILGF